MNEDTSRALPVRLAVLLVLLILHAVCGVIILWLLLNLVPQYVKIFKDFNARLPDMTIMVIDLSGLFAKFWYVLVPGLLAGDVAVMLLLNRSGRTAPYGGFGHSRVAGRDAADGANHDGPHDDAEQPEHELVGREVEATIGLCAY